jgi:hypothetical protein
VLVTLPPAVTTRTLTFAFPLPEGRWHIRSGTAHLLDGRLRAIDVPDLGTRVGPGQDGGLSAFFYLVYAVRGEPGSRVGTVVRWEVENGLVTRADEVVADADLVE